MAAFVFNASQAEKTQFKERPNANVAGAQLEVLEWPRDEADQVDGGRGKSAMDVALSDSSSVVRC